MAKKVKPAPDSGDLVGGLRDRLATCLNLRDGYVLSSYNVMLGIPIPSLAFQWLINSNVFPLSRVHEFAGVEGTCKSTFLYELIRWHARCGGHTVLVETEQKDNVLLRNAILEYNVEWLDRITAIPTTVYQEWVRAMNSALEYYSNGLAECAPIPVVFCIDSLTAAAPTQSLEAAVDEKVGYASGGYPVLAKLLSMDLPCFVAKLRQYPFTLAFTNHYKPSMNPYEKGSRPGGKAPKFFETLSIQFQRAPKGRLEYADGTVGMRLILECLKNSMGQERRIETALYYKYEPNPNHDPLSESSTPERQKVYFDWGESDIRFLINVLEKKQKGCPTSVSEAVAKVLDLHVAGGQRVWSHALGIPETGAVPYTEAGKRLMELPGLVLALQHALHIHMSREFHQGEDYHTVLADAMKEAEQAIRRSITTGEPLKK